MSYIALARKYRPQTFDELIGQEFVSTSLKNAISLNRVSHAYLFTGARGVGKTSAARILAKALNCLNPVNSNPCNKCENCIEITEGTSIDVVEIDGASNRGIDEIRQLREAVNFIPVKFKYKVYIIDEVHMLTEAASNALLKTLEEPPSYVIFIFATTDAHKIIPTILSRCQKYDFKKLPYDDMYKALENIYDQEGVTYEQDALSMVIRESEGCMRDALSFSDRVISYSSGNLTNDIVAQVLGIQEEPLINEIYEAIVHEDLSQLDELISNLTDTGVSLLHAVERMITHTRNILFLRNGGKSLRKGLTKQEIEFYERLIKIASEQRLFAVFQTLQKLHNDLKYSSFARYTFEFGMYKAGALSRIIPLPVSVEPTPPSPVKGRGDRGGSGGTAGGDTKLSAQTAPLSKGHTQGKGSLKKTNSIADGAHKKAPIGREKTKKNTSSVAPKSSPNTDSSAVNGADADSSDIDKPDASKLYADSDGANNSTADNSKPQDKQMLSKDENLWHNMLNEFREDAPDIVAMLMHASLEEFSKDKVTIVFPEERAFQYSRATQPKSKKIIDKFFSNKLSSTVVVGIINSRDDKKALIDSKTELEMVYEEKIKRECADHPAVQEAFHLFGCSPVDLKIFKDD